MIFEVKTVPFVLRGRRTTLTFSADRPCRFKLGRSYAMQVRHPRVEHDDGTVTPARIRSTDARVKVIESEFDAETGAWRVVVELDREQAPRFLHRRSEKGYTHSTIDAMPDEPEAIDDRTLNRFADEARERHAAFVAAQETRSLAERLAALERLASGGADVRHQLMAIERRIRAAERKAAQRLMFDT